MASVALDPVLAAIAAGSAEGPGAFAGTPTEARARLAAAVTANRDPENEVRVERITDELAEVDGRSVPVRICWPHDSNADRPLVVFAHGGGFTLLSAKLSDDITTRLSAELGAIVVAVDYRLAPEHPFPAALDDVLLATTWAAEQAPRWGASPDRLVLMGESAGANIVASASILLAGDVSLALQVLVVPSPDVVAAGHADDVDGSMLRTSDMATIREYYFGGDLEVAGAFPASAAQAPDLALSPPTVVVLAGFDPTAPVGRTFADSLRAAGVGVEVLEMSSMFHPFLGFAHVSPGAGEAFSEISASIRGALEGKP